MNKREMELLERAYSAEVAAALNKTGMHLMQTKSRLAEKLTEEGFLRNRSIRMHGPWPCTVDGYELTEAGRLAYCLWPGAWRTAYHARGVQLGVNSVAECDPTQRSGVKVERKVRGVSYGNHKKCAAQI